MSKECFYAQSLLQHLGCTCHRLEKLAEMLLNAFHWDKIFEKCCGKKLSQKSSSKNITAGVKRCRDQAWGRLGRNSRPRGRNCALNGTQGEVGVSLKKKKKNFFFFFFFFRETHFYSVS